jgi:hypothetical protein
MLMNNFVLLRNSTENDEHVSIIELSDHCYTAYRTWNIAFRCKKLLQCS